VPALYAWSMLNQLKSSTHRRPIERNVPVSRAPAEWGPEERATGPLVAKTVTTVDVRTEDTARHSIVALLPIMGVISIAFLIIGVALPVLPLHVHQGLGLSTFVVGLVTGSQFGASLISRVWAGRFADSRGPKREVIAGLVAAFVAGLLYLVSLAFMSTPSVSVSILLAGRALLGAAESFIITGTAAWGLALAGPQNAGRAGRDRQ
jgi:hypothetical protein